MQFSQFLKDLSQQFDEYYRREIRRAIRARRKQDKRIRRLQRLAAQQALIPLGDQPSF